VHVSGAVPELSTAAGTPAPRAWRVTRGGPACVDFRIRREGRPTNSPEEPNWPPVSLVRLEYYQALHDGADNLYEVFYERDLPRKRLPAKRRVQAIGCAIGAARHAFHARFALARWLRKRGAMNDQRPTRRPSSTATPPRASLRVRSGIRAGETKKKKNADEQQDYLVIKLNDVLVTS
jgi:hypothetical protein